MTSVTRPWISAPVAEGAGVRTSGDLLLDGERIHPAVAASLRSRSSWTRGSSAPYFCARRSASSAGEQAEADMDVDQAAEQAAALLLQGLEHLGGVAFEAVASEC